MDTKRCDNLACVCDVEMTRSACGDYCAGDGGRDANEIRCKCGHPKCANEMEKELSGSMG